MSSAMRPEPRDRSRGAALRVGVDCRNENMLVKLWHEENVQDWQPGKNCLTAEGFRDHGGNRSGGPPRFISAASPA